MKKEKNDFCGDCRRLGKLIGTSYCYLFNQAVYPNKTPRQCAKCSQLQKKDPAYFEQLTGIKAGEEKLWPASNVNFASAKIFETGEKK